MTERSEAQKAEDCRDIKAFEIAKAICDASSTYGEALYLIEKAANMINRQRDKEKPSAGEYPVDRYGQKVETPDMIEWQRDREAPTAGEYPCDRYGRELKKEPPTAATEGGEDSGTKIKGITVDLTN